MKNLRYTKDEMHSVHDPFGMVLVVRNWTVSSTENYRFGFNGQEQDDEVYGNGNLSTAMFWEYDTRLGRRWNVDPKSVIGISGYSTYRNNPIIFMDPAGDTALIYNGKTGELLSIIYDDSPTTLFILKNPTDWEINTLINRNGYDLEEQEETYAYLLASTKLPGKDIIIKPISGYAKYWDTSNPDTKSFEGLNSEIVKSLVNIDKINAEKDRLNSEVVKLEFYLENIDEEFETDPDQSDHGHIFGKMVQKAILNNQINEYEAEIGDLSNELKVEKNYIDRYSNRKNNAIERQPKKENNTKSLDFNSKKL